MNSWANYMTTGFLIGMTRHWKHHVSMARVSLMICSCLITGLYNLLAFWWNFVMQTLTFQMLFTMRAVVKCVLRYWWGWFALLETFLSLKCCISTMKRRKNISRISAQNSFLLRKSACRQVSRQWSRNLSWLGANFEWSRTELHSAVQCCTVALCTLYSDWDTAIDAELEYNRISSIVENSIDEENNVDGGFSNLEKHKKLLSPDT